MMSEYTPTTEDVAYFYEGPDMDAAERRADFERWLAAHDAEVRATPVEPTNEMVEAGAFTLDEGAMDSPADYPLQAEAARSAARDVLTAALNVENKA